MPKHYISFNLPEETDAFNSVLNARTNENIIHDFTNKLRDIIKYESLSELRFIAANELDKISNEDIITVVNAVRDLFNHVKHENSND